MKRIYLVFVYYFFVLCVHAQTITQWNFNGATGTTTPSIGTGSISNVGGTTSTFASGAGSSDPESTTLDQGYNLAAFPAQGTANKTAGLEVRVSTVGKQNIKLSFDLRLSATAAKVFTIQYSTDGGATWVDFSTVTITVATTWVNGNLVDFSSITALNNNANARFRVVTTLSGNAGTAYEAVGGGSYGVSGTSRFDMVTVQGTDIPLPVTYYAFNARYTESKTVAITWSTSMELNNAYFDIERSADIQLFKTIGRIDGKGTSYTQQHYLFTDETPMAGWNYYRLKQVDADGKTSYSKALPVFNKVSLIGNELSVWPNPVDRELTVQLNTNAIIKTIAVYTLQGALVRQLAGTMNQFDVSALSPGNYVLEVVTTDSRALRQRFVKP